MERAYGAVKRRRVLVDRQSQLYLVLVVLLYILLATVATLAVILAPSIARFSSNELPIQEQFAASREFLFLDRRVVPVVLLLALGVAVHFVYVTQRVFGPLVRLKRVLQAWRENGAWPPTLTMRQRDFHAGLFEEFNASVAAAGRELAAAREHLRVAVEAARGLDGPAAGGAGVKVEEECRLALEPLERWRL